MNNDPSEPTTGKEPWSNGVMPPGAKEATVGLTGRRAFQDDPPSKDFETTIGEAVASKRV